MAAKRDYYEVLGVGRDASPQEIKSAYRRLAVRYHPDRNPGDAEAEERFKEAAEAYAVLSDPEKRGRYDHLGHEGAAAGGFGGFSGFDPTTFGDFADILGEFFGFGEVFGGARRRGERASRGADLRYDLAISFEEGAFGVETKLRIPRQETCPACAGRGSAEGKEPSACGACQGRGQILYHQGFLTVARTCPQCRGSGRVITDPCPECEGRRRVERDRTIEVKIPPGVDTGTRLRLEGEGEHGLLGGPRGDLYVVIHVEPHPRLVRDGFDVVGEIDIGYPQAVLGGTVGVETLEGEEALEIPPGTSDGEELVLPRKGIRHLSGSGRGDHRVRVRVRVPHPRELTDEQKELLRRLSELEERPARGDRRVIDRVKDLFG